MTACKFNLGDTTSAFAEQLRASFSFPDVFRGATAAGRKAVSQFVMDVVTSDAALHAVRGDILNAGLITDPTTAFADAFGNLGNVISARQQSATAVAINPILDSMKSALDTAGITDAGARKTMMANVGKYRDALHAVERYKVFRLLKASYKGNVDPQGKAMLREAKKAVTAGTMSEDEYNNLAKTVNAERTTGEKERRLANEDFLAGKLTREEFMQRLEALATTYGIDEKEAATIAGMDITHARNAVNMYERTNPDVVRVYNQVKPEIDAAFAHIIDLNTQAGRIGEDSKRYLDFYRFEHYSPAYSATQVNSLNESSVDNLGVDTLNIAEGGLVADRIPFFAALHIQLNSAARAVAENQAIGTLHKFASAENPFGYTVSNAESIYGVTDTGHSMARLKHPPFSIPYCHEGTVSWVNVNPKSLDADAQLFQAIKNRLTQQFNASKSTVDRTLQTYLTHMPARLFTNLNPAFWLNSAVRDPLHVLTNLAIDSRIPDKTNTMKRVLSLMAGEFNHVKAFNHYVMLDAEHRQLDASEFGYWAHRLAVNGGETVFARNFYSQDYIEGSGEEVPYDLGGRVSTISGASSKAIDVGRMILNKTSDLVTAFDMQARTATFRALVEGGMPEQEAASIVREFMDFSQKGLNHNTLLTLVPFFRTSVVAAHRMTTSLLYDAEGNFAPKYEPMAAMITLGFLWAVASGGDKDEDGIEQGEKLSNSSFFANLTIGYDENGNARHIPLPYGAPSIFVGLGAALYRATNGIQSPSDVFASYALHAAKNILPLSTMQQADPAAGTDDSILSALANLNPVLGQINQLVGGKDAFGRDIYADNTYSEGATQALEGKVTTPDLYKDMAIYLHDHIGMDVYPETIQQLLRNWTPLAAGRALDTRLKNAMNIVASDDTTEPNMLASMINGAYLDNTPSMYNYQQYRKAVAMLNDIKRRLADPELSTGVTPAMMDYTNALAPYIAQMNSISSSMRNAPEEVKPALRAEKQRLAALVARVSLTTQK